MRSRPVGVASVIVAALLFAACGGDEAAPSPTSTPKGAGAGGSKAGGAGTSASAGSSVGGAAASAGNGVAGSGATSAGASNGGNAGNTSSGNAGNPSGGTAGNTNGGNAGNTSGGNAGNTSGGNAGNTSGGNAGNTSGGSAGNTSGGSAGNTSGGSAGGPVADVCASKKPVCPAPGGLKEGGGLLDIDRCAFPITEAGFGSYGALVAAIESKKLVERVGVANVLADLNRDGKAIGAAAVPGKPPGVKHAFGWADGDQNVAYWIPQGLTGSADGSSAANGQIGGKSVLIVSFYYSIDDDPGSTLKKGVRLAFVDVSNPAKPAYRFALLVEPTGTAAAPSYGAVNIHAGGIAWVGDYLYVADTGNGFRVFDLTHVWDVAAGDPIGCTSTACTAAGYAYAIPQVGRYKAEDTCSLLFSYVSLDKSTNPPTLVSGEYCSNDACSGPLAGRVVRWPLDPSTGRLSPGTSWPSAAHVMQQRQVQGAAARNGVFYLSSSKPAGAAGELYRVTKGKSSTSDWIDTPEDLLVDEPGKLLWSLSEGRGERFVMGAALSSYPAP